MSLPIEIFRWVARNPDKLEPDFSKTGGYRSKCAERHRDAAHFVKQFTVGTIREAFVLSGEDSEANSTPGTIAFRVRTLATLLTDPKMTGTTKLAAEKTLWEIACYGALSHEPMELGESTKPASGNTGLNETFRNLQFGDHGA